MENPSSKPIIAQLVALNMYPDLKPILVALKDRCGVYYFIYMYLKLLIGLMFAIVDFIFRGLPFSPLSRFSSGRNTFRIHNPICTKARVLTDVLGVVPHQDTLVLLIEPGGKVVVPVHFIPSDEKEQLSLLLIR